MDKGKKAPAEGETKTPEEIAAQRKAKKAEKAAKKIQSKSVPAENVKEPVVPASKKLNAQVAVIQGSNSTNEVVNPVPVETTQISKDR